MSTLSPTSSATSPALSESVSVPPAPVAVMLPPAATDPVPETLRLTVVPSWVAVIAAYAPITGCAAVPHPPCPEMR